MTTLSFVSSSSLALVAFSGGLTFTVSKAAPGFNFLFVTRGKTTLSRTRHETPEAAMEAANKFSLNP